MGIHRGSPLKGFMVSGLYGAGFRGFMGLRVQLEGLGLLWVLGILGALCGVCRGMDKQMEATKGFPGVRV